MIWSVKFCYLDLYVDFGIDMVEENDILNLIMIFFNYIFIIILIYLYNYMLLFVFEFMRLIYDCFF